MATLATDTFTEASDTALESHTASGGGTWAKHVNFATGATVLGATDRVEGTSSSATSIYYHSATPPVAEYDVTVTVNMKSGYGDSLSPHNGIIARVDTSATTFYQVYFNSSAATDTLELLVTNAGASTTLGTYTWSPTANTDYTIRFEVKDATKKVFLNGTERISSVNNDVTAAGKIGIRCRSYGRVDNYSVTYVASDAPMRKSHRFAHMMVR